MVPTGSHPARIAAVRIIETLRDRGHEALLAGGCVRDTLLGGEPHDFDVATSARPEEVEQLFPRTIPVGAQFGVIIVMDGAIETEVATFRADGEYSDGRRPEQIRYANAEADAQRRDFTINGLFLDPLENRILDFVNGQRDLADRLLRAIGDPRQRFAEDKLRLLRTVRFATTLDFAIDPTTWRAVREHAKDIHQVSAERIRAELWRTLVHPNRVRGFDLLDESGLLAEILPEVAALKGCEQPPEFHPEGDVFVHTRIMLGLLPANASPELVFAVLFHDIGKPPTYQVDATGRIRFNGHEHVSARMTETLLRRLRCSNEEIDTIVPMVENHMAFKDVQQMRVAKLKRFIARPTFEEELELHRVDCTSSHGMLDNLEFLIARREEFANEPLIPEPLITGRDLIDLGWKPGPRFKEVLEEAQTRQLEGTLRDRTAALAWLKGLPL